MGACACVRTYVGAGACVRVCVSARLCVRGCACMRACRHAVGCLAEELKVPAAKAICAHHLAFVAALSKATEAPAVVQLLAQSDAKLRELHVVAFRIRSAVLFLLHSESFGFVGSPRRRRQRRRRRRLGAPAPACSLARSLAGWMVVQHVCVFVCMLV